MRVRKRERPQGAPNTSAQDRQRRGGGKGGGKAAGKGGASRSGGRGQKGRGGGSGGGGGRGRGQPRQRPEGPDFWGDPAKLPEPQTDVRITEHHAAVPRSLGSPPLPGHEAIAQHYFEAVYERSVTTAGALAAAGGLIDPEALVEELSD